MTMRTFNRVAGGSVLAVALLSASPAFAQPVEPATISAKGAVSPSGWEATVTVQVQCPVGYRVHVEAYVFQKVGKHQVMGENELGAMLACTGEVETVTLTVWPFADIAFRPGRAKAAASIEYWGDGSGGEVDSAMTAVILKRDASV